MACSNVVMAGSVFPWLALGVTGTSVDQLYSPADITADPAEIDFPFDEPSLFQDLESGTALPLDPAALARDYRARFSAHRRAIDDLCTASGFESLQLRTDAAPIGTLRDCLARRLSLHGSRA